MNYRVSLRIKKAIAALLEEVDLTGYAKRKPNTLSGGQKQRIAIARALIKSPEIIMADEPTGALDSATGKQVFDTLKKLSRDKLVIIVSHDRDFAEQYADRIIELKDGKILSDVTKTEAEKSALTENITAVGDTLCIKNGKELGERDFHEIINFLKNSENEVIIATGERDVESFKDVNRITSDGTKEVFLETDEDLLEKKVFKPEDARFIRSKLPLRHAVKMGASGLKTKPIRLIATTLLCTIAFVMFGLLSTMMFYDSEATLAKTLTDSNYEIVKLAGRYKVMEKMYENGELRNEYESYSEMRFSKSDVLELAQKHGNGAFGAVSAHASFNVGERSSYYLSSISGFAYLDEQNPLRQNKIINGTYPEKDDEILISRYMAEVMVNCGIFNTETGAIIEIANISDAIGQKITIDGQIYKVSGILDSPDLPEKYDVLKDGPQNNYSLENNLENELRDGVHSLIFMTEKSLNNIANRYSYMGSYGLFEYHDICIAVYNSDGSYDLWEEGSSGRYAKFSEIKDRYNIRWLNSNKTSLQKNEILLNLSNISNIVNSYQGNVMQQIEAERNELSNTLNYGTIRDTISMKLCNDYAIDNSYSIIDSWEKGTVPDTNSTYYSLYEQWQTAFAPLKPYYDEYNQVATLSNKMWSINSSTYGYSDPVTGEWIELEMTDQMREQFISEGISFLEKYVKSNILCASKLYNSSIQHSMGDVMTYTVVGFYESQDSWGMDIAVNDEAADEMWDVQKKTLSYYNERWTNYVESEGAVYSAVYVSYDHSASSTEKLVNIYSNEEYDENDTLLYIQCSLVDGFSTVDSMVTSLSQVFLYAGIVIAVFAALLLSNFISVSISHKKREIGILRAVGARSLDVFKIFFSESFIIAAVCTVLSTGASILLCEVLNAEVSSIIGASLFVFNLVSIGLLVAIAIATAVVATFLPVYNAAKKKPVESIRAL